MRELLCDDCGHEWNYKGSSKRYATCPSCLGKVDIRSKEDQKKPPLTMTRIRNNEINGQILR